LIQNTVTKTKSNPEFRLGANERVKFAGYNNRDIETQIRDNQSPYMLNMNADDRGALTKRKGQEYKFTSLGTGTINGAYEKDFKGKVVFVHSGKLYTQSGSDAPVERMSGLGSGKMVFFSFNDKLYGINGTDYIVWDDAAVAVVVGYVPTTQIGRKPDGSAFTEYESRNFLSAGFINTFNSDGVATKYYLSEQNLDVTLVEVWVNGVLKTEDVHFTVNRVSGYIDFAGGSAPLGAPTAGSNNVKAKPCKTIANDANVIKKCRYVGKFDGAANDSRVFFTGNPDLPSTHFISGANDPTYFPYIGEDAVGSSSEASTGFLPYYTSLILFKENSLYTITSEYDSTLQRQVFPVKSLNSTIGCDMPFSIQLIKNNPVFFNSVTGGHIIVSTQIADERNVKPISALINGAQNRNGILDETDILTATSVDDGQKYWLCIDNKAWVWDYDISPYGGNEDNLVWFPYTNINANCWTKIGNELYYGDRDNGYVSHFIDNYNDFGVAIEGVWRSKLFSFGYPDWLKNIIYIWYTTRSGAGSTINIKYYNDNGEVIASQTIPASENATFSWATFAWDTFTFAISRFAPSFREKPNIKKVQYFQIEFSNNEVNQNLSLLSLVIQYQAVRKVK
jgi:hypothetical protein